MVIFHNYYTGIFVHYFFYYIRRIMKASRRVIPDKHGIYIPETPLQVNSLPFYIKEIGFSDKRRLVKGSKNNYSDYIILYSLTDMIYVKYNSKSLLAKNDIVFSSCNTPLTFVKKKNGDYIYIIISGTSAQFYYNYIRNSSGILHTSPLSNIIDYFLAIINLNRETELFLYQMEAGTIVHQLLLDLYKISKSILETKSKTPVQDSAIMSAIHYIEDHYNHNLTIDTICESVGFSKYYFGKRFKENTGMTLHQYVVEYRLNKSKDLMSYTNLSIAAIANSVGFNNTLTFSRQFKTKYNMTPSEYREYN